MSPPHLGVGAQEGEGQISMPTAVESSAESLLQSTLDLKERNYMGLSDSSSSVDSCTISPTPGKGRNSLNLKATELRLGLPGSQSPERDSSDVSLISPVELSERPLFPLRPLRDQGSSLQKNAVSGNKRGFSDAMDSFAEAKGKVHASLDAEAVLSPRPSSKLGIKSLAERDNSLPQPCNLKEVSSLNGDASSEIKMKKTTAPAPKAQVVGWPPVKKSLWKNSMTTTSKITTEVDEKSGPGAVFVKVSMDGAPYLRKIDLASYKAYQELSFALERMFSCFTIGQCASHGATGKDGLCESKLKDLLHGSEFVLTYEDKDGDWMLVGDVPWEMFTDNCKRLRIMKGSDAIGLAPRAVEKCRSRS